MTPTTTTAQTMREKAWRQMSTRRKSCEWVTPSRVNIHVMLCMYVVVGVVSQETHGGTVSTSFGDAFLTAMKYTLPTAFGLFSRPIDLVGTPHSTSPLVLAWSPGYFSCILVCCMYGGSLAFQPLPFRVNIIAHAEGCGAAMWD